MSLFIKYNKAYIILLLYCIASSFWSKTILYSFYQAATLFGIVYFCWIYFYLTKDLRRIINSITLFLNVILCFSLLYYFLAPEYAVHQFGILGGALKGIMKHKNLMGQVALFAFFFNLERLKHSKKKIDSLIMLVLAVVVLFMTKSIGTTVVFLIGIILFAVLSRAQNKRAKVLKKQNLIIFIMPFLLFSLVDHPNSTEITMVPSVFFKNRNDTNTESRSREEDEEMIMKQYNIALTAFPWLDSSFMKELIFPQDKINAYIVISDGYTRRGLHGIAFAWLKRGLKEDPDNIFINKALFLYHFGMKRGSRGDRRNNLQRADFYLKKLLRIDRENSLQYLQDRIDLYLYYNKYNKAEKMCLKAMNDFPMEEKFIIYLGRIHIKRGNDQQLEFFLNKLKENDWENYNYLMFLKMSKDNQDGKALDFLEKWLEIKEIKGNTSLEDYEEKFWFLYRKRHFRKAQMYFRFLKEKFIDDNKSLFEIVNIEALLFERNGNFKEAKEAYTILASQYPWLKAHYHHKMKIREFGTIGPWLTKLFSETSVEANIFRLTNRDFTFGGRSKRVYDMTQSIKENPLFGKGYEGFLKRKITDATYAPRVRHAHNGYLKNINELGLVGFAILFWILIDLFVKFVRLYKSNNKLSVLLLTLFVILTLLNMYYTLFLCINFALIVFNVLLFAAVYSEKKADIGKL